MVQEKKISHGSGKTVLAALVAEGGDPAAIVEREGLAQISDSGELESIVAAAIEANPEAAEQIRAGNGKAIGAIVGAVMKETKGRADGGEVNRLIKEAAGPLAGGSELLRPGCLDGRERDTAAVLLASCGCDSGADRARIEARGSPVGPPHKKRPRGDSRGRSM